MRSTIKRGLAASNSSGPRFQPSIAPGRKFSISTSASRASLRTTSWPSGVRRSSASERLLRDCTCHHTEVPSFSRRHLRKGSPVPGGSILTTSAPKSASVLAAKGAGDQLAQFQDFQAGQGGGLRLWWPCGSGVVSRSAWQSVSDRPLALTI
jgi:hypothetical protein